jgi:hypothetical protein
VVYGASLGRVQDDVGGAVDVNGTPERPEHPPAATAILTFLDETIGAWELFADRRGDINDDGAQLLAIHDFGRFTWAESFDPRPPIKPSSSPCGHRLVGSQMVRPVDAT